MIILVTGALGYIGSHICAGLLKEKYHVIGADIYSHKLDEKEVFKHSITALESLFKYETQNKGSKFVFFNCDMRNIGDIENIFEEQIPDIIIHAAAFKSMSDSISEVVNYHHNNVVSTLNLTSCMERYGTKKLIFASSASVYGGLFCENAGFREDLPLDFSSISSPYGKSKRICVLILEDICERNDDWNIFSLRYFNPIGKKYMLDERPGSKNILPVIKDKMETNNYFRIYGSDYDTSDGTCERDYFHIEDLVDVHIILVEKLSKMTRDRKEKNNYTCYNLASGKGVTVKKIIDIVSSVTQKEVLYEIVNRREGDYGKVISNIEKIKRELNWEPKKDVEDAVFDYFFS